MQSVILPISNPHEKKQSGINSEKEFRHKKPQNILMTPSQNLVHSRKLLQIKTIGVPNHITDSKVKEEHDVINMKPSSEYFSKLNYVTHIREDSETQSGQSHDSAELAKSRQVNAEWEKSFSDAINEVNIQNKEYLENIDLSIQKRFSKLPGLLKKTVVFGLDGVLVKTNFEPEGKDWKPTTLILDEKTRAKIKIYVSIRPYVVNTLKQLRRTGMELILYSTSKYNYTTAILNVLTKQRIEFHHII